MPHSLPEPKSFHIILGGTALGLIRTVGGQVSPRSYSDLNAQNAQQIARRLLHLDAVGYLNWGDADRLAYIQRFYPDAYAAALRAVQDTQVAQVENLNVNTAIAIADLFTEAITADIKHNLAGIKAQLKAAGVETLLRNKLRATLNSTPRSAKAFWNHWRRSFPVWMRNLSPDSNEFVDYAEGMIRGIIHGLEEFALSILTAIPDVLKQMIEIVDYLLKNGTNVSALWKVVRPRFEKLLRFLTEDTYLPPRERGELVGNLLVSAIAILIHLALTRRAKFSSEIEGIIPHAMEENLKGSFPPGRKEERLVSKSDEVARQAAKAAEEASERIYHLHLPTQSKIAWGEGFSEIARVYGTETKAYHKADVGFMIVDKRVEINKELVEKWETNDRGNARVYLANVGGKKYNVIAVRSGGGGFHSETRLNAIANDLGLKPGPIRQKSVKALYSEFEPCPKCKRLLTGFFAGIPVYYSYDYPSEVNTLQELKENLRKEGRY